MADNERYEDLLRLIAALTERVYKLEQAAGLRQTPPPTRPVAIAQTEFKRTLQDELESKIGGHWLNRIGIVAVLIGVLYFLKYAFDNEWIGSAGRVLIGLAGGLGVVFWSEYVRRSGYAIFSYSLKAVGIGVLYLSLWASSQLYHLIPTGLAFVAMASVTAATVALALCRMRKSSQRLRRSELSLRRLRCPRDKTTRSVCSHTSRFLMWARLFFRATVRGFAC